MAEVSVYDSRMTETSDTPASIPLAKESNEAVESVPVETSQSTSKNVLPAQNLSEQEADGGSRTDAFPTSGKARDDVFAGDGEIRQTMNQMNQGINEIAASVKSLCLKFTTLPVQPPWPYPPGTQAPPLGAPPPPRSPSASSSSASIPWMQPPVVLDPKVRECDWEDFMNRFSDEQVTCAIEVLLAGPDLRTEIDQEKKKRGEKASKSETEENSQEASSARKSWIQQVRIQSAAISLLLKMLLDKEQFRWDTDVKTFKRPFRCFIHLQPKVKAELKKIEEYLLRHPIEAGPEQSSANPEPQGEPESSEPAATAKEDRVARLDPPERSRNRSRSLGPEPEELTTEYIAKLPGSVEQIRCFVEFVDKDIFPFYQEFDVIDPKKPPKVRYEDLWYIFRVGELLYAPRQKEAPQKQDKKDNQENSGKQDEHRAQTSAWEDHDVATRQTIWRIHAVHIPGDQEDYSITEILTLHCHRIDYDGTEFGAVTKFFQLKPYDDERNVTSLAVYPLRFAAKSSQILDQAKATGRKLLDSIHDRHGAYSGWTLLHDPQGQPMPNTLGEFTKTPEHINSEIIVDFHEGLNQCPWWKPNILSGIAPSYIRMRFGPVDDKHIVWSDPNRKQQLHVQDQDMVMSDGMHDYEFEEYRSVHEYLRVKAEDDYRRQDPEGDDLALLPRRVIGYALWERKFVQIDVQILDHMAVTARENAFDKLEISQLNKKLIQSIVSSHFRSRDSEKRGKGSGTQDIIRGKGKGLVLLLHGVPGVGKTATAEAVAQKWGKPLFPITCGDLGLTPESVEKSLSRIFRLAHLWDCVLLLDEADVFISRRTQGSDLPRNAMVSVFLRMLEYFNGILFLTTNLPGYLDEAVKSRVHLNLRYDALTVEQVKGIFRLNINQLNEIERERSQALGIVPMDIFEEEIIQFAEEHWNNHTDALGRWNGRQIRNAFSIAASLAHFDAEGKAGRAVQLRKSHFQEVEKATVLYDNYRYSILTESDGFRARKSEARNDDFNEQTFTQRGRGAFKGNKSNYSGPSVQNTPIRAQVPYEQGSTSPLPHFTQPIFTSRAAPEPTGFSQAQQAGYSTPQQKQSGLYPTAHASPQPQERPVGGLPPTPQDFYPGQQAGQTSQQGGQSFQQQGQPMHQPGQPLQQQFAHPQTSPLPYRDDGRRDLQAHTGYGQAQPSFQGSGQYGNM